MDNSTQPATVTSDPASTPAPRLISHAQMREHQNNQLATALSPGDQHRMFVRYDNTWWIADQDGFIEITSTEQNGKLDRWHTRLTDGALWT